jgi:hypothetical protein
MLHSYGGQGEYVISYYDAAYRSFSTVQISLLIYKAVLNSLMQIFIRLNISDQPLQPQKPCLLQRGY